MLFDGFVEVRASKFGKGLFALKDFDCNELICQATGKFLTFEETLQLDDKESHSLQIEKEKYILCEAPFLYTNHSCNPNCGLNSNLQLYTLQPIKCGEEFFWDYSTSMLERHWTMKCNCGSTYCRHLITDFDLLPQEIQYKYLQLNIVLPFIVDELVSNGSTVCRA
ncbi:MAG TPA: SET domain-containing protein [Chitinophagaceae bacterium]|jgi:hypothetical protein|nr:SET domain-containing protein [Chitinophagaceae bacterium]